MCKSPQTQEKIVSFFMYIFPDVLMQCHLLKPDLFEAFDSVAFKYFLVKCKT